MYLLINVADFVAAYVDSENAEIIADNLQENADNLLKSSALLKQIKPLLNQKNDFIKFLFIECDCQIKIEIFTEDISQMKSILELKSMDFVQKSLWDEKYNTINITEFLESQ